VWEALLRHQRPQEGLIQQWVERPLFYDLPAWVFTLAYLVFAGAALVFAGAAPVFAGAALVFAGTALVFAGTALVFAGVTHATWLIFPPRSSRRATS